MAEPKVKIDVQMSCNGLFSTMAHLLGIFRVEIFPALAGEEKASALLRGCIQVQEKRNTGTIGIGGSYWRNVLEIVRAERGRNHRSGRRSGPQRILMVVRPA